VIDESFPATNFEGRRAPQVAGRTTEASIHLADIWTRLLQGSLVVVDGHATDEHHVMRFRRRDPAEPLTARQRIILERGLTNPLKSLAIDLELAPSTLASAMQGVLAHIGLDRRPSRVPVLIVLAARAATGGIPDHIRCESEPVGDGFITRIPRVDHQLDGKLTPSEIAVVRSLIEGNSYVEIAKQRQTSVRTVANQIAAVFRRLRVSGRSELISQLCESFDVLSKMAEVPPSHRVAQASEPEAATEELAEVEAAIEHLDLVFRRARAKLSSASSSEDARARLVELELAVVKNRIAVIEAEVHASSRRRRGTQ
jgi:DNA-binding CsgD family transcriptional regulator